MALVAYGDSDSSGNEEDTQGPVNKGTSTAARQSVKIGLPSFTNATVLENY